MSTNSGMMVVASCSAVVSNEGGGLQVKLGVQGSGTKQQGNHPKHTSLQVWEWIKQSNIRSMKGLPKAPTLTLLKFCELCLKVGSMGQSI